MARLVLDLALLVRERMREELLLVDLNGRAASARIPGAPEGAIRAGSRNVDVPAADVVPIGLQEVRLILVVDPDIRVVIPDTVAPVPAHLDAVRPPRHLSLARRGTLDVAIGGGFTGIAVIRRDVDETRVTESPRHPQDPAVARRELRLDVVRACDERPRRERRKGTDQGEQEHGSAIPTSPART